METVGTSTKIKCLIEMALKGEIAWTNIDFLIENNRFQSLKFVFLVNITGR